MKRDGGKTDRRVEGIKNRINIGEKENIIIKKKRVQLKKNERIVRRGSNESWLLLMRREKKQVRRGKRR